MKNKEQLKNREEQEIEYLMLELEPKKQKTMLLRIDQDLHNIIKTKAKNNLRSVNKEIEYILIQGVMKHE